MRPRTAGPCRRRSTAAPRRSPVNRTSRCRRSPATGRGPCPRNTSRPGDRCRGTTRRSRARPGGSRGRAGVVEQSRLGHNVHLRWGGQRFHGARTLSLIAPGCSPLMDSLVRQPMMNHIPEQHDHHDRQPELRERRVAAREVAQRAPTPVLSVSVPRPYAKKSFAAAFRDLHRLHGLRPDSDGSGIPVPSEPSHDATGFARR